MGSSRRHTLKRCAAAAVAWAGFLPVAATTSAPSASASSSSSVTIVGHGWGHGRGMGQYGALGYALAGWTYPQILAHYYGGTSPASTTVASIPVSISELYGASSVTVNAPIYHSLILDGTDTGKSTLTVTRGHTVATTGSGDLIVAGPWPSGSRDYLGSLALPTSTTDVINQVDLTDYVEGVVPRESPASWPAAALSAQAVAARSYALAYTANGSGPICDTGSCQVYGGDPTQYPAPNYSGPSDAAVTATGNEVLQCGSDAACGSSTQIAFTEFSSSTGGYTAGGAFPAVVDAGDATPTNPNHDWSVTVSTAYVQSAYPAVGTLQSVTVTTRNGLGDMGGRVLSMVVIGTKGHVTVTGEQFAGALGLNSDWFTVIGSSPPPGSDSGYWVVAASGGVYPFGAAPSYGSMAGYRLTAPVIGMAPTGDGAGYWLVAKDGGIFSFGDARFYGSTGGIRLVAPVVDMASTSDSGGYWMAATDGGVFGFGDARFYGSTGGVHLTRPVVAIARTGDGKGYWMVASDGGVFNYGDAHFYGSTADVRLAAPIVGMVPTTDGRGYWLVASDGGVFAFGDAGFVGSLGGSGVNDVVSVSPTPDGRGYLLVRATGTVYAFGDATYMGDPASTVAGWSPPAIGVFTG